MTVDIQCEGCGGVAKVALYGFDIVPGTDSGNGIAVAQIVKSGIIRDFRNMHYGTEGLRLTLEKCRELVREDEVYMACFKYNKPSLAVMLNNGARIVREDSEIYYTRVRIR